MNTASHNSFYNQAVSYFKLVAQFLAAVAAVCSHAVGVMKSIL